MTARRVIALLVLLLALCGAAFAQIPRPRGFVNDYANVIDATTEAEITAIAQAVQSQTGAEIAVLTVESFEPYGTIEQYAIAVAEEWQVGSAERDDGVILVVAVQERRVKLEVGYGLEGPIPDGRTGEILDRHVVPDLRENNYGAGLKQGVAAVAQIIADEYGVTLSNVEAPRRSVQSGGSGVDIGNLIYVVFVLLFFGGRWFFLPLLFGRRRRGFFGGGFGSSGGRSSGGFSSGFGGFGGGSFGGGGASRGF